MDSLTFTPGRAFLSSNSTAVPWTAVFEDEGNAGYFYACDRSQETHDHSIMDAMLIYNRTSLANPTAERLATIQWSRDGQQCVLYLDGTAQGLHRLRHPHQLLPLRLPQLHPGAGRHLAQEHPRLGRRHPPALRSRPLRLTECVDHPRRHLDHPRRHVDHPRRHLDRSWTVLSSRVVERPLYLPLSLPLPLPFCLSF